RARPLLCGNSGEGPWPPSGAHGRPSYRRAPVVPHDRRPRAPSSGAGATTRACAHGGRMRLVDCDKLSTLLEGTIPVRTTIRYPTRYAAFDNPGSIVLCQPGPNDPMRGEVAVFHLPMPNEHW